MHCRFEIARAGKGMRTIDFISKMLQKTKGISPESQISARTWAQTENESAKYKAFLVAAEMRVWKCVYSLLYYTLTYLVASDVNLIEPFTDV